MTKTLVVSSPRAVRGSGRWRRIAELSIVLIAAVVVFAELQTAAHASPTIAAVQVVDSDGDGVDDSIDNCVDIANADQESLWATAILGANTPGDACVPDYNQNGIADLDEPHVCASVNGIMQIVIGNAQCTSKPPTTAGGAPNIAIATGDRARANAQLGNSNTAIAEGDNSLASVGLGDRNTAIARGDRTEAYAQRGDDNTATIIGDRSVGFAWNGDRNTAIANGDFLRPTAGGTFAEKVSDQTVILPIVILPFQCSASGGVVSWPDEAQTRYWVYQSLDGGSTFTYIGTTTGATTFAVPNAQVGALYQVHYPGIARVDCDVVSEPEPGNELFACASDSGVLTWTDDEQSKYWVYRSLDDGESYSWIGRTLGAVTFTDPDPQPGALYQVHYAGYPRTECAIDSEPAFGMAFACSVTDGELTWSDKAQGLYWVYRSVDGGTYTWIGRTTGATAFSDPAPIAGATYQVHYAGIPRTNCVEAG